LGHSLFLQKQDDLDPIPLIQMHHNLMGLFVGE